MPSKTRDPLDDEYSVERVIARRTLMNGEVFFCINVMFSQLLKFFFFCPKVEYYLKWEGYSAGENTWEPEQNLHCPEIISAFEGVKKPKIDGGLYGNDCNKIQSYLRFVIFSEGRCRQEEKEQFGTAIGKNKNSQREDNARICAWVGTVEDFGYLFCIYLVNLFIGCYREIGATGAAGEVMFIMKWKGTDESDLVPAKQANIICPQIVIHFYEERVTWNNISFVAEAN